VVEQSNFNHHECAWHSVTTRHRLPLVACKWFMKEDDVRSFQKVVLGDNFQSGCDQVKNTKLRILVLDRKGNPNF